MTIRYLLLFIMFVVSGWLAIFGDKTPHSDISEPVIHSTKSVDNTSKNNSALVWGNKSKRQQIKEPYIHSLELRTSLASDTLLKKSKGLFDSQTWAAPSPSVQRVLKPVSTIPLPPVAPPLPFTYLGKKLENGVYEVYLGRGTETLIVREKMTIDNVYKVNSISKSTLYLTYLPFNQVQVIPIGGSD